MIRSHLSFSAITCIFYCILFLISFMKDCFDIWTVLLCTAQWVASMFLHEFDYNMRSVCSFTGSLCVGFLWVFGFSTKNTGILPPRVYLLPSVCSIGSRSIPTLTMINQLLKINEHHLNYVSHLRIIFPLTYDTVMFCICPYRNLCWRDPH